MDGKPNQRVIFAWKVLCSWSNIRRTIKVGFGLLDIFRAQKFAWNHFHVQNTLCLLMTRGTQNDYRQMIIKPGVFKPRFVAFTWALRLSSDFKRKIVVISSCAAVITLKLSAFFVNYPKGCWIPANSLTSLQVDLAPCPHWRGGRFSPSPLGSIQVLGHPIKCLNNET